MSKFSQYCLIIIAISLIVTQSPLGQKKKTTAKSQPPNSQSKSVARENQSSGVSDKVKRVAMIKKSVVQVISIFSPDGKDAEAGTGFIVRADGLIATASHVVRRQTIGTDGKPLGVRPVEPIAIYVRLNDKALQARIYSPQVVDTKPETVEPIFQDICILKVQSDIPLIPVNLGTLDDAQEGDDIYISGFPLGINVPVTTFGMLSTKVPMDGSYEFRPTSNNPSAPIQRLSWRKQTALLDITQNKGNSGGPVILVGKNPDSDKVIGIVSFQLTPINEELTGLVTALRGGGLDIGFGNVSFVQLFTHTKNSIERASVGVGGCVSTQFLLNALK